MSKEARTISGLVAAISEEMVRLDYKPSVLKQHHIVWDKLCKRDGDRPADDFNMDFGMQFLDEAMHTHARYRPRAWDQEPGLGTRLQRYSPAFFAHGYPST